MLGIEITKKGENQNIYCQKDKYELFKQIGKIIGTLRIIILCFSFLGLLSCLTTTILYASKCDCIIKNNDLITFIEYKFMIFCMLLMYLFITNLLCRIYIVSNYCIFLDKDKPEDNIKANYPDYLKVSK